MGGPALYLPLRTATLPPATHTNCVFLPTDLGFFLVDPAPVDAEERQLLLRCVHAKEAESGPLLGLVLSHLHYDHLGAAGWLAERLRIPVYASEATAEDLKSGAGAGFSAGGASGESPRGIFSIELAKFGTGFNTACEHTLPHIGCNSTQDHRAQQNANQQSWDDSVPRHTNGTGCPGSHDGCEADSKQ